MKQQAVTVAVVVAAAIVVLVDAARAEAPPPSPCSSWVVVQQQGKMQSGSALVGEVANGEPFAVEIPPGTVTPIIFSKRCTK